MVFGQALAQTIKTFGNGIAREARQRLGAHVDLDARDHAQVGQVLGKRHTGQRALAQGLVIENDAADVILHTGSGEQHVAIGAATVGSGLECNLVEALLDGAGTFIGG